MLKHRLANFFSQYRLDYPRSLIYILQASEYDIGEYLTWYRQTQDFRRVERRKRLVYTPKAVCLLVLCWLLAVMLLGGTMMFSITRGWYVLPIVLLLLPVILAYGILIPLVLAKFLIQKPAEFFVIRNARTRLASHKAVKVSIAGSFGKTTMREILKTVVAEGKKVAAPPHSYNTPLGISRFIQTLNGNEEVLIFELGEHYPGDIKKLCDLVRPDIGVITGVNEAHLEKFKTLERTTATIFELADYLGEKRMYVNGESERARGALRRGHITYDRTQVGQWQIHHPHTGLDGTAFTMIKDDTKMELHSSLLGLHQIGPLAAAADIALSLGLSPEQVKSGIANTKPFDHRLEPKTDTSGVVTLDDSYNGNPDGVKAVIEFLTSLEGHRRWYVTPGLVEMGPKTEQVHREIGRRLAEAEIEHVILVRNSVTPFIAEGLKSAHYAGKVMWFDDALAAFAALPHLTVRGDVVLLQNDWPDQYR
ncbi:UDP-N-acetylmuramoyl-tripeptide--D-alanyl-D-alanine ligase [Candidatus Kaiserbacteria bacterium]|nr:UDP-N-acetylmuramoyl-tripeptide--D-alanyl-D-alanine ligase [Candidatus Kaiserbacteria bacterium]